MVGGACSGLWELTNQSRLRPSIVHRWKNSREKSNTDNQTKATWETAWMPAVQPDWGGGGGGKTTVVPGNQLLLARGSAETMVISGRLKHKPKCTWLQMMYLLLMTEFLSFVLYSWYLLSLVLSLWELDFAEGRKITLIMSYICL